jgi:hypothetical protein
MSVTSLIDRISPFCQGWDRSGTRSLLTLIQEGQDDLLDSDANYMLWVGTGNQGFPPYLKTSSGVYRYSINSTTLAETLTKTFNGTAYPVRIRRVKRIFVDVSTPGYNHTRSWIGEPYVYNFRNPYSLNDTRLYVADMPIRSYVALENTDAYIDFIEDPGETTERYFAECIWEAPRLTSEAIPLVVPKEFERALEDYVIGKIEELENGDISKRSQRFLQYWMPLWKERVTGGVQLTTDQVEPIFC